MLMQAKRYQEAIDVGQQALHFFQSIGDSFWITVNASNLAESRFELGEYADAEALADLVMAEDEPQSHPYALITLGRIHQARDNLSAAEVLLNQARSMAKANEDPYLLAYCWEAVGNVQHAGNEQTLAQESFSKALALFQSLEIQDKIDSVKAMLQEIQQTQTD